MRSSSKALRQSGICPLPRSCVFAAVLGAAHNARRDTRDAALRLRLNVILAGAAPTSRSLPLVWAIRRLITMLSRCAVLTRAAAPQLRRALVKPATAAPVLARTITDESRMVSLCDACAMLKAMCRRHACCVTCCAHADVASPRLIEPVRHPDIFARPTSA